MGKYNFDEVICREGTSAMKMVLLKERFGREDLKPLWIADMDFLSPPAITEAIIARAKHGIFGYTSPCQGYYSSILNWTEGYHNWKIEQEWLAFIPGIVKGMAFAVQCFLKDNDKVVIQPPVYPPFKSVPNLNNKQVLENHLILEDGKFKMDFEGLKDLLAKNTDAKMLILCNPHNPGGTVWSKENLVKLADICAERGVLVVSDEIHADLAFGCRGYKHIPFASVSEKAKENSITFMAPSKSFNIAGIISSYSIIPNDKLRAQFNEYLEKAELSVGHIFAFTATEAAYNHGKEWLEEAKEYIWKNVEFVDEYLQKNIPQIKAILPEASFLIWLDCRGLNLCQQELVNLFVNGAGLALNDGTTFGIDGKGFMRFNVGVPRSVIEDALESLKKAITTKQCC